MIYEYTDRLFENDSSKPIFIDPIFTFYNEKTRKEPAGMKTLNLQALVRKYLNKDVMNKQVSYYMNGYDVNSKNTCNIDAILNLIKTGGINNASKVLEIRGCTDKENKSKLKMMLPVVLFSGTFTYRSDKCLDHLSSFMVFDFDHFESEIELQDVRTKLIGLDYIYSVFRSPSGDGLKAIVYTDNLNATYYTNNYIQLLNYFTTNVSDKVDTVTTNISRSCFVSYDQDIYINPEVKPYKYTYSNTVKLIKIDKATGKKVEVEKKQSKKDGAFWSPDKEFLWKMYSNITDDSVVIKYLDNFFNTYRSNDSKEGFRRKGLFYQACDLCLFGVHIDNAKKYLLDKFTGYGLDPIKDKIENEVEDAYRTNFKLFGTKRDILRSKYKSLGKVSFNNEVRAKTVVVVDPNNPTANGYKKWTLEDETELTNYYNSGKSIEDIACIMKRTQGAINSRLIKIGLIDDPEIHKNTDGTV